MRSLRTAAFLLSAFAALTTQAMSTVDALKGVYYSAASYCAYDTLDLWTCGTPCLENPGIEKVYRLYNLAKATFGFAGYNNATNEIIFGFRGTNGADFKNWATNLDSTMIPYPGVAGARIHSGFYEAYSDIKSQVHEAFKVLVAENPTARIFLTGHSLGGALAVVAAIDLKETFNPSNKMTLYTYGQPRVGDDDLSDHIFSLFNENNYFRVVNYDDTVPHNPIYQFRHAGTEVWYKSKEYDGIYFECEN